MFCVLVFAVFQVVVNSETGVGQLSQRATAYGPVIERIVRLERVVTNMTWELKLTKINSETSKTDLAYTKTALKSTEQKLASAMAEIAKFTDKIERKGIAFQVKQGKGRYTPGNQEPLKFDTVILNEGDGYNPTSGIFTVPRTGNYLCWANVLPDYKNTFNVRLIKEGIEIVKGYTGREQRPGTATITNLMKFKKGEHVWFDLRKDDTLELEGGGYCSYGCSLMML